MALSRLPQQRFLPAFSTGIGDHESKYNGTESEGTQGDEQFEIDDNRSLDKMYRDITGKWSATGAKTIIFMCDMREEMR